jgi:hypothetical protein
MTSIMFPVYGKALAGSHAKKLLQMVQQQGMTEGPLLIHIFRYDQVYVSG